VADARKKNLKEGRIKTCKEGGIGVLEATQNYKKRDPEKGPWKDGCT